MIAAVIFSNTTWTFWDVMVFLLFFVPLVALWFYCIYDIFRRNDMSGWEKAIWLLFIIVVPYLGVIFYLLFSNLAAQASYNPR